MRRMFRTRRPAQGTSGFAFTRRNLTAKQLEDLYGFTGGIERCRLSAERTLGANPGRQASCAQLDQLVAYADAAANVAGLVAAGARDRDEPEGDACDPCGLQADAGPV